ncbi:unnamed protein product, partial [Ixodes pacificus]
ENKNEFGKITGLRAAHPPHIEERVNVFSYGSSKKGLYCSDDKRRTLPSPRLRCVFPRSTQPPMLL